MKFLTFIFMMTLLPMALANGYRPDENHLPEAEKQEEQEVDENKENIPSYRWNDTDTQKEKQEVKEKELFEIDRKYEIED